MTQQQHCHCCGNNARRQCSCCGTWQCTVAATRCCGNNKTATPRPLWRQRCCCGGPQLLWQQYGCFVDDQLLWHAMAATRCGSAATPCCGNNVTAAMRLLWRQRCCCGNNATAALRLLCQQHNVGNTAAVACNGGDALWRCSDMLLWQQRDRSNATAAAMMQHQCCSCCGNNAVAALLPRKEGSDNTTTTRLPCSCSSKFFLDNRRFSHAQVHPNCSSYAGLILAKFPPPPRLRSSPFRPS